MAHRTRARVRLCPCCDGFAVVAVTSGARHRDGRRVTVRVTCPTCHDTGTGTGTGTAQCAALAASVVFAGGRA